MPKMYDRGMVKWQPFDSLLSTKKMCSDILKKKNVKKMVILSEDQLNIIEKRIIASYYNKSLVNIIYYYNGNYFKKKSIIKYLDEYKKEIILNDGLVIHFGQIVNIS